MKKFLLFLFPAVLFCQTPIQTGVTGTGGGGGGGGGNVSTGGTLANGHITTGAGGTNIQDSGKTLPSGTVVGTTDTQVLTNKSLSFDQVVSGINAGQALTVDTGTILSPINSGQIWGNALSSLVFSSLPSPGFQGAINLIQNHWTDTACTATSLLCVDLGGTWYQIVGPPGGGGGGTVTTSGSPTSGQYAKFTGSTVITGQTGVAGADITGSRTVPETTLPLMTTSTFGIAKPDNSTITVSAGVLTVTAASAFQSSGVFASIPATCTPGSGVYQYFVTDKPLGQQWYYCSATNTWTQFLLLADSTLTMTSGALGVNTSIFAQKASSESILGFWDHTGAAATAPHKAGLASAIPATCGVAQTYFETDATAGQNIYACTATDTWTLQGGGGATKVWFKAFATTTQTIGASSQVNINFDGGNNADNTAGVSHSTTVNPDQFTVATTGFYHGACQVRTGNDVGGSGDYVFVYLNGVQIAMSGPGASINGGAVIVAPFSTHLTAGDVLTCPFYSNSGISTAQFSNADIQFWVEN